MQKILSISQIREADAYTIAHEPIASIDLMERAAMACYQFIKQGFSKGKSIHVFCGMGNNGGDGLAIARMLFKDSFQVHVYVLHHSKNGSNDFSQNLNRLKSETGVLVNDLTEDSLFPSIQKDDLVIDAIFGSGLSKPVNNWISEVIESINASSAIILSIDIPSGFFIDSCSDLSQGAIVKADYTLSFQFPKKAFLFPEADAFVGDWRVLDIGLHQDYIHTVLVNDFFITKEFTQSIIKPRKKFSHKGSYGHALLIAGSYGMGGAAVLSSKAALRSGVGLLTVFTAKSLYSILQTSVPEAMVQSSETENSISGQVDIGRYNAVAIGPGIGKSKEAALFLKLLIQQASKTLILDADAINMLSENPTWLSFLPKNSILTPHLVEFERLAGKNNNSFERNRRQLEFSRKYHVIIVLKGAYTCITTPEGISYFNSTGNPGMATGGSGDVLTGMICGLLAQGYPPAHSAILGVFLHGLAGDLAAEKQGEISLIASDIIENIGNAINYI